MAPPRSSDTKAILDSMHEKFAEMKDEISSLRALITTRDDTIDDLKSEVTSLRSKVGKLENLIDDEVAYIRRESLIFSGSIIPLKQNDEICSDVARKVLKEKLKLELQPNEISVCHRLGPKPKTQGRDTRPLTVRFGRRGAKRQILFTKRDNSDPNTILHINESLTPKRRAIVFALRQIRKANKDFVTGCNTLEGRCFAYTKLPGSLPNTRSKDRKHVINTHEKLVEFCNDFIKKPLEDYLDEWSH